MKTTDFIVEFLISKGVADVFGYPGGVICHFIDSLSKYDTIKQHLTYHEQGAAFAACGYAQERCSLGVAYATSGPGATNLITGIANAFYDSIPVIFFTGQVDTYGLKGSMDIRQRGFQETDMVSISSSITKYSVRIDEPNDIKKELEKAYYYATEGNPGPVLIDLPADVQRAEINVNALEDFDNGNSNLCEPLDDAIRTIVDTIRKYQRPCLLIGNGVKQSGIRDKVRILVERLGIPAVFSMPAVDALPYNYEYNFGFIGANGHRYANFVLGKCDLIIVIGSRMDLKQVGNDRERFAPQAMIIRVDIDRGNLGYKVHKNEMAIRDDIRHFVPEFLKHIDNTSSVDFSGWMKVCKSIKKRLEGYDDEKYTKLIADFSEIIKDDVVITADVGQSEVWVSQNFRFKRNQSFHISGGHGAMGYSLPAAIGSYYASGKPVVSFNGDGGIQMNIQELQFVAREYIPICIVVINNHSLGMIRGFQEANFEKNYQQTTQDTGYLAPDFSKLAAAYDITYKKVRSVVEIRELEINYIDPVIVEIEIQEDTILNPNFGQTGEIQNQRPYLPQDIYEEIMHL